MTQRRFGEPLPLGDDELPYSKGLMARALIAAGVTADRAYGLARAIEVDLAQRGERTVDLERFQELAHDILGAEDGERATRRLRRYRELQALDVPIIILIGGSTGTGKSTVATEVAHRLGITRVTSTDFIRQTMRAFFSAEFMPSIHHSSFEAGVAAADTDTGDPTILGYIDQCRNVNVGVNAAIQRSLTEGWSMVLEGVHLVPGMLPLEIEGALVLHVILEIESEEAHRTHFHIRDITTGGLRAMEKYLSRLDDIRKVQSFLVARAQREGVHVIKNGNVERTIGEVIELVMALADRVAPSVPAEQPRAEPAEQPA
jgi:2-phosphoglycerate kinase